MVMNEAVTRKRLVEKALANAGWTPIVDYVQGQCEHAQITDF